MSFDWKSLIKTVAPTVATALGGPLAGAATQAVSTALLGKTDGTEEEIMLAASGAGPEVLQKLKDAENTFKIRMRELDIDVMKLSAADTADAREREIKTGDFWTPRIIAGVVVLGWFSIQWFLLQHVVPQEMREIILRTMGTMDMALGLVLGYYFGSSASSARKDETIIRASR